MVGDPITMALDNTAVPIINLNNTAAATAHTVVVVPTITVHTISRVMEVAHTINLPPVIITMEVAMMEGTTAVDTGSVRAGDPTGTMATATSAREAGTGTRTADDATRGIANVRLLPSRLLKRKPSQHPMVSARDTTEARTMETHTTETHITEAHSTETHSTETHTAMVETGGARNTIIRSAVPPPNLTTEEIGEVMVTIQGTGDTIQVTVEDTAMDMKTGTDTDMVGTTAVTTGVGPLRLPEYQNVDKGLLTHGTFALSCFLPSFPYTTSRYVQTLISLHLVPLF